MQVEAGARHLLKLLCTARADVATHPTQVKLHIHDDSLS